MSIRYSDDFKKEVVKAYMAGDKSTVQIAADYNIAKSTISQWVNQYKEECRYTTNTTPESLDTTVQLLIYMTVQP